MARKDAWTGMATRSPSSRMVTRPWRPMNPCSAPSRKASSAVTLTFIPLGGTQVGPDDLRVSVTKEQVRAAPDNEVHGEELSQDDESARYHHFDDELHSAGHEAKARPVGAAQSFLASTCRAGDQ